MDEALTHLAAVYREHGAALLGYLHRAFGRVEPAEDLLQETLLRLARRPEPLLDAAKPRAWLFSVARKVGLTALRRRKPTEPLPAELPATPAGSGVPANPALERMRAAIDRLPSPCRETLVLRLSGELSYEEIAAVLNVPVGTVRSRLHHAVRALRAALTTQRGAGDLETEP